MPRGLGLAILAAVVWGTVPVAGTIALGGITSGALSAVRLVAAGAFLLALLKARGVAVGRPSALVAAAALALGCNYVCYMWGVERAGPGTSQVLIVTAPLFLILLGIAVLRERLSRRQLLGTVAAAAGVLLVSFEKGSLGRRSGIALVLVSALAWGIYGILHKRVGRTEASGPTIMWVFLIAGLCCVPPGLAEPLRRPDSVEVAAIAYLCVNTVVAYWSFAESLRHIDASLAGVVATLGPVVTFLLLLVTNAMDQQRVPHESFTAAKLCGAVLVMGGVAAAVSQRR